MARLIVPCGLPGSGKSAFIKDLGLPPGRIFSPDAVIGRNGRYDWSPEHLAQAWRAEYRRFGRALQLIQGLPDHIVLAWDATFISSISRSPIINMATGAGMRVDGLFFNTPLDLCLERNAKRSPDRRVPPEKIQHWYEALEEPRLHEGYDTLVHVTDANYQKILGQYLSRPTPSVAVVVA